MNIAADLAMRRLVEGNARYVDGVSTAIPASFPERRKQLAEMGQRPFACILTCTDSRVPAELVFDQTLGDLFVARVGGNIVAPSIVGSIEFAAFAFETELCVVMGHTRCGVILASVDRETNGAIPFPPSENLNIILNQVRPIVNRVRQESPMLVRMELSDRVARENVKTTVENVRNRSAILRDLETQKKFRIVGAMYDIASGIVEFL